METTEVERQLEGMLPMVEGRCAAIEHDRRLPRELVDALRGTGVFALEVPRAIGGREAQPAEILHAIETISRADGSTGWCVAVAISNNGVSGLMPDAGAREVFADPTAPSTGLFAPAGAAVPVDGGVRVSGRWQFASGITHSDWIWMGCRVMEDGKPRMSASGPEVIHALVPTASVQVHDTWFASGLCGTASHDVSVKDVFVPGSHLFSFGDPTHHRSEPLYHMPIVAWFVAHIVAVSLGLARGALDQLIRLAQGKVPTFSTAVLADRATAQLELARAEASLAAARALLYEAVDDLWQTVKAGAQPTPRQVAVGRIAAANAAEVGASVTRTASVLAGAGAVLESAPFQRHARDADAIAHHFTVSPHVWEDAGRVFMGRTPTAPMF